MAAPEHDWRKNKIKLEKAPAPAPLVAAPMLGQGWLLHPLGAYRPAPAVLDPMGPGLRHDPRETAREVSRRSQGGQIIFAMTPLDESQRGVSPLREE